MGTTRNDTVQHFVQAALDRFASGGRVFDDVVFGTRTLYNREYAGAGFTPTPTEVRNALRRMRTAGLVKCMREITAQEGTKYWWYPIAQK
jgi:transcription initiation factor IIE alpha subunit